MLLIHGVEEMESFELLIRQLSIDALKAMHKSFRYNRLRRISKASRIDTFTDLLNRLLLISDLRISSNRNFLKKERRVDEASKYI